MQPDGFGMSWLVAWWPHKPPGLDARTWWRCLCTVWSGRGSAEICSVMFYGCFRNCFRAVLEIVLELFCSTAIAPWIEAGGKGL